MHLMRHTACCLALALAAGTAFAQDAKPKPAPKPADKPAPASADKGRDWTQIDTNKDGLVSPEEMEAWLKANPGPAK